MPLRAEPAGPRSRLARTTAVVGLLLACAGLLIAALVVPGREDSSDAHRRAGVCAGNGSDLTGEECVQRVGARVVQGPYWRGERHASPYRIDVRRNNGSDAISVELDGDGRADGLMASGDKVTLWYWRGDVQAVGYNGRTILSTGRAEGSWRAPAAFAVFLTVAGGALVMRGGFRLLCGRRVRRRNSWHVPVLFYPVLVAAPVAAFGTLVAERSAQAYGAALVIGGSAAVPGVLVALYCLLRRPVYDDTVEVEPRVPDSEHVLRGFVLDPAYRGYQTLIIGPRTLAASPLGGLAPRPLPQGLVFGRIRRQWHTDPLAGYVLGGENREPYHIAECPHDGGVLLIAAETEALALLAGALGRGVAGGRS